MELDFSFLQQSTLFAKYFANSQKLNLLYKIEDYRDVVSNVRRLSESLVKELFAVEQLDPYYPLKQQKQRSFRSDLFYLQAQHFYPQEIMELFHEIRRMGNDAVHDNNYHWTKQATWHCLGNYHDILVYLMNTYEQTKLAYIRPDLIIASSSFPTRSNKLATNYHETWQKNHRQKRQQTSKLKKFLRRKK